MPSWSFLPNGPFKLLFDHSQLSFGRAGTPAPLRLVSYSKYDLDAVVPIVLAPNFHQPQNSGTISFRGVGPDRRR